MIYNNEEMDMFDPDSFNNSPDHNDPCDHSEPHNHREGEEKRHRHGRRRHPAPPVLPEEAYNSLDTDGKLNALLHDLSHMSRFGMENRGGQNRILQILAQDGDMTQRDLTSRLGIQPGSVSELLGKLERAGYITRSANETDRRTTDVHLTEAGKDLISATAGDDPALFSALNEEEKEQLLILLEKLRADWRERFPRDRREPHGRPMGPGRGEPHGRPMGPGRGESHDRPMGPGGHGGHGRRGRR